MSNKFMWIAVFAVLSALVNGIGIWAISKKKEWVEKTKNYFMCFAAGILVTTPLILALPNALEKTEWAGFAALGGFLFMFFSKKIINYYVKEDSLVFGTVTAQGIGIHSFVDGVVYAVTFQASILVGVLAATGMVMHEFSEGVITYSALIKSNVKEKKAFWSAFAIAGLTTPLGAFVGYPIISLVNETVLGGLLGFVAGVLLFVSASHLLPEAEAGENEHSVGAFSVGVAIALFIFLSKFL
ncbi:MAG: ZIP family metal transporter [Patescibacteria group bacterium]